MKAQLPEVAERSWKRKPSYFLNLASICKILQAKLETEADVKKNERRYLIIVLDSEDTLVLSVNLLTCKCSLHIQNPVQSIIDEHNQPNLDRGQFKLLEQPRVEL